MIDIKRFEDVLNLRSIMAVPDQLPFEFRQVSMTKKITIELAMLNPAAGNARPDLDLSGPESVTSFYIEIPNAFKRFICIRPAR